MYVKQSLPLEIIFVSFGEETVLLLKKMNETQMKRYCVQKSRYSLSRFTWVIVPVLHYISSLQDEHLDRFLALVHAAEEHKIPPRIGENNFETELKKSVSELSLSKSGPLVHFLPLLLDKLVSLMVRPPIINGQVGE